MTYGKTLPFEMVCSGCGRKAYAQRKNKVGQKQKMTRYCKTEKKKMELKPKQCKHSN